MHRRATQRRGISPVPWQTSIAHVALSQSFRPRVCPKKKKELSIKMNSSHPPSISQLTRLLSSKSKPKQKQKEGQSSKVSSFIFRKTERERGKKERKRKRYRKRKKPKPLKGHYSWGNFSVAYFYMDLAPGNTLVDMIFCYSTNYLKTTFTKRNLHQVLLWEAFLQIRVCPTKIGACFGKQYVDRTDASITQIIFLLGPALHEL